MVDNSTFNVQLNFTRTAPPASPSDHVHQQQMMKHILYVNASISLCIAFIATFGNLLLILIFYQFKYLRNINNRVITFLSIGDLLRGSFVMPIKIYNHYTERHYLRQPLCNMTAVFCGFTFVFSPLVLALIAFIRYGKIIGWKSKLLRITSKKVYGLSFLAFLIALSFSLLPIFGEGVYEYSTPHGVCFAPWQPENRIFRSIFYSIVIGVAFSILTISYLKLYLVLRKHRIKMEQKPRLTSNISRLDNIVTKCNCNGISKKTTKTNENIKYSSRNELELHSNVAVILSDNKDKNIKCICKKKDSTTSTVLLPSAIISRHEYHVTKLMIMIFIAYCVCWLPAAVVNVIALVNTSLPLDYWKITIVTMVELKSALDPLIYGLLNREYRKALSKLLSNYKRYIYH